MPSRPPLAGAAPARVSLTSQPACGPLADEHEQTAHATHSLGQNLRSNSSRSPYSPAGETTVVGTDRVTTLRSPRHRLVASLAVRIQEDSLLAQSSMVSNSE
jgi:hypothetical protein